METEKRNKLGDLFENKDGNKLVYIGKKALPVLQNKKIFNFWKRDNFSFKSGEWFVRIKVSNFSFFLPVLNYNGVQYTYTQSNQFQFLNQSKLVRLKKNFNHLRLDFFEDQTRNLPGMNNLDYAFKNFQEFNYDGFPSLPLDTKFVEIPLKNIVHEPLRINGTCGPCGGFYPATQQIFTHLQMYENLLSMKEMTGIFVNKDAKLVSFKITQPKKLKFKFEFNEIFSEKSLTIEAQSLFDLRKWYKAIPPAQKEMDFICIAGCVCPKDKVEWGLMDLQIIDK